MNQNFKTPNRIKNLMTDQFLITFRNKLLDMFKAHTEGINPNAWNFYYHIESTCGWSDAFKYALENHNYPHMAIGISRYQMKLDWYDWDIFCYDITMLMIKRGVIEEGSIDDYI